MNANVQVSEQQIAFEIVGDPSVLLEILGEMYAEGAESADWSSLNIDRYEGAKDMLKYLAEVYLK